MKLLLLLYSFTAWVSWPAFAQKPNWLITKLQRADSVVLVSHQLTYGLPSVDSSGHRIPLPELVIAGKPNYTIVKERRNLTPTQRLALGHILIRPFKQRVISEGKCFMPHHAIFIIRNHRLSYIDICFGCSRYVASDDLDGIPDFYNRKIDALYEYFKKLGFKYEMGE